MEWLDDSSATILCVTVPILAIALIVYIVVKFGYELKLDGSAKKVEVTRKETPTKTKH